MRILVTGATGVIGRRVVPLLIAGGHQVTAAGRNPERLAALQRAGAAAEPLDLLDREAVRGVVPGHDVLVNLATHIPSSSTRMMLRWSWRQNDRIRRDGSAILAEEASRAGVKRFVQESFAPIYEDAGDRWIGEGAPVRTVPYNRSARDAERSAEGFTGRGGSGVVLRFGAFYGPDARHVLEMLRVLRRGWAPLPGAPGAYLSSISHDDAAGAVLAALDAPAGIYNVVDDEPLTRREYFDAFADAFALPRTRLLPAWAGKLMGSLGELLSRSQRISNRRLRALGWVPRYPSARDGFRAMAAELRGRGVAR